MENRLKRLKSAMQKNVFSDLEFKQELKGKIHRQISDSVEVESNEQVMIAILQIVQDEKSGFEIMQLLRARGMKRFNNHEGMLYTILHEYEQKGWLQSIWTESVKMYSITNSGRKILKKTEGKKKATLLNTDAIFEG